MKIKHLIPFLTIALLVSIPVLVKAQDASLEARAAVSAEEQKINREKMRVIAEPKDDRGNGNERNVLLKTKQDLSSSTKKLEATKAVKGPLDRKIASSTATTTSKILKMQRQAKNALRMDAFKLEQNRVVRQAELALNNLKQVRQKISDRIAKAEASGRTMTNAKAALAIADTKIAAAESAILAIKGYVPTSSDLVSTSTVATASSTATSTAQATTTVSVSLEKPRKMGDAAFTAIKEAKRALNDVVVAIAKSMGFKIGQDGKIIPGTTATTTPTTSTTTPPVTSTTTPPVTSTSTTSTTTPPVTSTTTPPVTSTSTDSTATSTATTTQN